LQSNKFLLLSSIASSFSAFSSSNQHTLRRNSDYYAEYPAFIPFAKEVTRYNEMGIVQEKTAASKVPQLSKCASM
jgi:hypothetical protein